MFKETIKKLGMVLYSPGDVFRSEDYSRSSMGAVLLVLFLLSLLTGFASFRVTNYEGIKDFQVEMGVRQALKMMPGASAEEETELREQIRAQLYNPVTVITSYVSLLVGVVFSLASALLLFWLYMILAVRFVGGEEEPVILQKKKGEKVKKHRNSFLLSAFRYVPLIIAGLLSMALLMTRSRESFYNIATLEEMTRKMTVNVTLYALFFEGSLPAHWETCLNILTSPFWWWSGWIAVSGFRDIWKVPVKKGVPLYLIWVTLVIVFQMVIFSFTSQFTS